MPARFRLLLSALLLLLNLGAAARNLELDIPVLVAGYGAEFFQESAREFERLRPGLRINLHGDPRINDKVRTRVMAGDFPDATDAVLLYPRLAAAGRLLDLGPALDGPNWEGDATWRDTFRPGVLDRWRDGPVVHGLPFAHAVWTLFYDRTLFRRHGWQPPRTWDEFFALCEKIHAAGLAPLSLPGVAMRYGDAILRAAHYNLVGPEGYAAYHALAPGSRSDPRFVRAAETLRQISDQHLVRGWQGMTHTAAQLAFLEGRSAMTLSASWFANEMKGRLPPAFELGAMNLPVFADGITQPDTVQAQSGYYFLFRTGDPAREQATIDFFRFLTSRERVRRFAALADAPSALLAAGPEHYSPRMADTAALLARAPSAFDAAPAPRSAAQAGMAQPLADARQLLMTGRIDAQTFAARLEAAAAAERARSAAPDHVDARHPGKTAALLLALLAALSALLWRTRRRPALGTPATALSFLDARQGLGFVGPAFATYAAFVLAPGLVAFAWALTHWDGFSPMTWAGLFNFRWLLLESDAFWSALGNNTFLMLAPPVVIVPVALALAAYIHRGGFGGSALRLVLLFPNILGGIAAALIWLAAYEPASGLVNAALVSTGDTLARLGAPDQLAAWLQSFAGHAWLAQDRLYAALVPIYLWMACGFNLVLYLAAMQGIPADLYEAAEIDGASPTRQFLSITLPHLREILVVSAVFLLIGGLNAFELVWLLTAQEPSAGVHTLATLLVSTLFNDFQAGRAAAIAVMLFALVMTGALAVLRLSRRPEDAP